MSMHRFSTLTAAVVAALVLASCTGFPSAPLNARDVVDETRALEPDGRFELENVNGRITLRTWSRDEVRIEATRAATSEAALEDIEVVIEGEGREVRVKTRYPKGSWFAGGHRGKVDYDLTVPRGADVRLKTVNGPVDVEGLAGSLRVESVNGGLELADLEGELRAQTVNGGIRAGFSRVPEGGRYELETVNGGIDLSLPEGTGGRLKATTVNGGIGCDLPLEVTTRKKRRLEGRLGPGKRELRPRDGQRRHRRGGGPGRPARRGGRARHRLIQTRPGPPRGARTRANLPVVPRGGPPCRGPHHRAVSPRGAPSSPVPWAPEPPPSWVEAPPGPAAGPARQGWPSPPRARPLGRSPGGSSRPSSSLGRSSTVSPATTRP